jgi:hypothetical protein
MLPVDGSTMWAWVGRDAEPAPELIDSLAAIHNADGVSIALGAPGHGVTGFRRTHRDAVDTARVAIVSRRRPGTVTAFHAVELAALLVGDPERTQRFVHERLGALARDDDEDAAERLRELNERIIEAGKKSGRAYLTAYEANLKAIADYQAKLAGSSDVDWVSTLLNAQADFTREIARAAAAQGRDLLK